MEDKAVETTVYSLTTSAPTQPDRRGGDRYLSLLRVGSIQVEGRRELCLIRNISAGGMMIRPYSPIEPGSRLSVELKHGESVSGIAQWAESGLVGITFDEPIDVLALLSSSGMETQPRMPRIEINCSATVREGSDVHRSRTVNISQGGLCVRLNADLRIGGQVVVSLAGLDPAGGVVKWRDADNYGIGFNRVLPVGELMSFLQERKNEACGRAAS